MAPPRSAANAAACADRDLLRGRTWWLYWCLPFALIVLGVFWTAPRPWLWVVGMGVPGAACLANARRCGRRHCYFTGPILLAGAIASLLDGLGLAALPWGDLLSAVVVGCLLVCGVECALGRYARPA